MLQELPENCGISVKALAHCATDPGIITRTPGRFCSTHLEARYSIVRVGSCGEAKTDFANFRWLTTCSPAIARTKKSRAALMAKGVLSIHFRAPKTTKTHKASSISFL